MKKIVFVFLTALILTACNNNSKIQDNKVEKSETKTEVAANYKSIEVEIEGMTCEIGCARTIESKLSKVEGITYSKVDFDSKKGTFTFDSNKLNDSDITNKINGIAGGDVYFAVKTTYLNEIVK